MRLLAPAKVNLYLRVKAKRPDGYHNIETLFERVGIFDKLSFKKKKKGISVSCDDKDVPTDAGSLCGRAAALLKKRFGAKGGAEIKIIKRIPVASGLGGGSSDAATVLLGLNKLWDLRLGRKRLIELGSALGADIPFFLKDKPFAVGAGRGDDIRPVSVKRKFWHVVVFPGFKLSTKDIYNAFDKTKKNVKSEKKKSINFLVSGLKREDLRMASENSMNDLENIALRKKPRLALLKRVLSKAGCEVAQVSGSGPSMFGLFKMRKGAIEAARNLRKSFPEESRNWKIFIVKTY